MKNYLLNALDEQELMGVSVLGLASIGDAVYELLVRSWLCAGGVTTSKGLHREAVRHVSAPAQARAVETIRERLTPEEAAVYKRGRNAKVNSVPQHADVSEYHAATGLEALFGHLYLKGEYERINYLFDLIIGG